MMKKEIEELKKTIKEQKEISKMLILNIEKIKKNRR